MRNFFRSFPWVDAWVDTWGHDERIKLIDLGGNHNPLEMVYTISHRLKGIVPLKALALAGTGYSKLSTPRAEYNNLDSLISAAGGIKALGHELKKLQWDQFSLADISHDFGYMDDIHQLASSNNWYCCTEKTELAYSVSSTCVNSYMASLGSNTRSVYFNRRHRLAKIGEIELINFGYEKACDFFEILNQFHIPRWGRPCYSAESIKFMCGLVERVYFGGGVPILQVMTVDGEVVSVIYDIEWDGVRYNLQSGYKEGRFPKIALGSIHFGYAIEEAIQKKQVYDFMAGTGKNNNYKKSIANCEMSLSSFTLNRGITKYLYKIYGK